MSKFQKSSQVYLENRKAYAHQIEFENLYDYIDHFGLYAGEQTIGNKLYVYELIKSTVNVPGHVMEFGTWKGANLLFMAKVMSLLSPNSYKKIYGFDNFAGLPAPNKLDGNYADVMKGKYKGDYENLKDIIRLFEYENYVELVAGDALETIPKFEQDNPEVLVSLAYIDFDLYEPVNAALTYLENVISVGGMIVFDEGIDSNWPGETIAMKEFLANSKHEFEMTSNYLSRQPTMALTRVR